MNAYEKSQQLGLTGTDAEIVAALQATGVTDHKIDLAYLMEMLNIRGMLRRTDGSGGQERWVGTLQNLKSALVAMNQSESVVAYETWFSHVTNPRQIHWDTTLPEYAAGFWAMKLAFANGDGMPSSVDFIAIAALGGGWLFSDLTVEEFVASKLEYEAQQAAEALAESARQAYQALRTRRQAWDTLAANIRSQIESGQLTDNAAVIAAVTTELGA